MHYFFNEPINPETVNNLMEKLDGKEDITLYFGTEGGETDSMRCLVSFFNSLKDNLEIVLTDVLASAGTMILTDYTGRLTYDGLDFILFHKFDRLSYPLRNSSFVDDRKITEQDEENNVIFARKLKKLGLTKKQLKRFNKGKDVVIYRDLFYQINL